MSAKKHDQILLVLQQLVQKIDKISERINLIIEVANFREDTISILSDVKKNADTTEGLRIWEKEQKSKKD